MLASRNYGPFWRPYSKAAPLIYGTLTGPECSELTMYIYIYIYAHTHNMRNSHLEAGGGSQMLKSTSKKA